MQVNRWLVIGLSILSYTDQRGFGQIGSPGQIANQQKVISRDYEGLVRFLLYRADNSRCHERLILTLLPSFHAEEVIELDCLSTSKPRITYRRVKEPVRKLVTRCFGTNDSLSVDALLHCAGVFEQTLEVDSTTSRAWLGSMFRAIESFGKVQREATLARPQGESAIQLDGTLYRLQYRGDVVAVEIALTDVEVDSGEHVSDSEIAGYALQIRDSIQKLLVR
jgi:hypothetical protein